MDQSCIYVVCFQSRNCQDLCIVHDNGVTFCMTAAFCISCNAGTEGLFGGSLSNGTGYYIGTGAFTI